MVTQIYSVWYSSQEEEGRIYSNNKTTLEEARADAQEVLRFPRVQKAWIKKTEHSTVETICAPLDPLGSVDGMNDEETEACLRRLQKLVLDILGELPAGYLKNHTLDSLPGTIQHYICELSAQTTRRKELQEEMLRLTEEKQKREALEEETTRLRKVICKIAENLGNGSAISEKASIEFIEQLPGEVKLVVDGLNSAMNTAKKNYSDWVAVSAAKKYNTLK
jgi:hypothetical protein